MNEQRHYVGLDVSLETTSICVIDDAGAIIWRGKCSSDPDAITATLRQHAPGAVRVGLETGQLSNWLTLSLRRRGRASRCACSELNSWSSPPRRICGCRSHSEPFHSAVCR